MPWPVLGRSATAKKKILKFTRFWSNETFSVSKIISIDKTIPISISNLVSFDTASLYYVEFPELFIIASLQKKSVEACSRLASQEISCLFLEPEVSWPRAQEPNDNPCFEPDENSSYPHTDYLFTISFGIIILCAPTSLFQFYKLNPKKPICVSAACVFPEEIPNPAAL